jgi:hypothetical protein
MVLAGGGFRFGYYLGMHAAACDAGQEPDLLLATCGGAVAGAIIAGLPDTASRKAWLRSPQMYEFLGGLGSSDRATPASALWNVARRRLSSGRAVRLPDLFNDYLFEMPQPIPLPPAPASNPGAGPQRPALAIIGGKLLFGPHEAGQPRRGRPIYNVTLFCDGRTAALAHGLPSAIGADGWSDAVSPQLLVDTTMPVVDAARISIADMVYFRCQTARGADYTGGVIDLFPIELARGLARHVTMEMKEAYDEVTAAPALRAAFGFDGNRRLRHVHAQPVDVWVDTSDVRQAMRGGGVQKRLDWRSNRIRLVPPVSYARYLADVESLWRFGYQRGQEAYALAAQGRHPAMRNSTRHNQARP